MAPATNATRPPLPPRASAAAAASRATRKAPYEQPTEQANALQQFGSCVRADLEELLELFVAQEYVGFGVWKQLWQQIRMSAMLHVEFWDSTPSDTHQTVLQQAVDLVVVSVDAAQLLQERTDVAQLIGAVFALYCSYSVQLGSPKLKIPVDPHAWASLVSIEAIMTGAQVQQWFPRAAAQVLAMLKRLEYDEKAFSKCLRGSNTQQRQSHGVGTGLCTFQRPERLQQQVTPDQVDRLAQLKEQYAQRISAIASQDSSTGSAGLRKKRDPLVGQVAAETEAREAAMDRWTQALCSLMETPAAPMFPAPAPLALERNTVLLEEDRDEGMSYCGDEDDGFALLEAELQADLTEQTTAPARTRGFSFASSDDALAELDAELSREVGQVAKAASRSVGKKPQQKEAQRTTTKKTPKTPAAPRRRVAATTSSSVPSSDAGSDDLAVLQAELDAAPNQSQVKKPSAAAIKTRATRNRPAARSVSDAESDDLAVLQTELDSAPAATEQRSSTAKRVQPRKTTTRKPRAAAPPATSAPLSIAESDDLATLQAELDAWPSAKDDKTTSSTKESQAPQRRAPRKPRVTAPAKRQRAPSSVSDAGSVDYLAALQAELDSTPLPTSSTAVAIPSTGEARSEPPRRSTRKRSAPASAAPVFSAAPVSVVSIDSAMNDLQAELESSLNLLKATDTQAKKPAKRARTIPTTTRRAPATTRARVPTQRKTQTKPRAAPQSRMMTRARSASSVASESDGLAELEAELQAAVAP